jgi:hypothetical protein
MKVKFISDKTLSYDGVNVTTYLKGNVYEAVHEKEKQCFAHSVFNGTAEVMVEQVTEEKHPAKIASKKVLTPKNKK